MGTPLENVNKLSEDVTYKAKVTAIEATLNTIVNEKNEKKTEKTERKLQKELDKSIEDIL